ncbi:hypothetical protein Bca4012_062734 [Brassica carinata]
MMRILARHANLCRSRTFRTISSSTNQTLQNRLTEALDQKAQAVAATGESYKPFSQWMLDNVVGLEDGSVNTSLLALYARSDKTLRKAEATFKKMRELGLLTSLSPYNAKTYAKAGSIEKAIEMFGVAGSKKEVYRLWNSECKKNEMLEDDWCLFRNENENLKDDIYKTVIATLLKLDDVEGAEKVYGKWKPVGPNLDLSIPGLLISRFCAEGNELKVGELINSIRRKRNEMQVRMVRAYIGRIVTYSAMGVVIFCAVVAEGCPWVLFWPVIF